MPPKDFASAPTFPQHLPEKVGQWEALSALNNDSGTIATYVKGADVISATWDFQDFGAYDLTVQAMTDAAYVGDLVCGADAAGLVMCLKVAKNGVLNVAGTEITSQDLAKIANPLEPEPAQHQQDLPIQPERRNREPVQFRSYSLATPCDRR